MNYFPIIYNALLHLNYFGAEIVPDLATLSLFNLALGILMTVFKLSFSFWYNNVFQSNLVPICPNPLISHFSAGP